MRHVILRAIRITALVTGAACGADERAQTFDAREEIRAALDRYMTAARSVNPDSIAASFAPTGVLLEPGIPPIRSPDSIRTFVAAFAGAIVESASVSVESIEVYDSTGYLWGEYFERLSFPGQARSEQRGRFVMRWRRQPDAHWRIERYFRIPLVTRVPAATPAP